MRPVPGAPIGDYFSSLLEIRNQIVGPSEAISDIAFQTHIFSSLPPVFEVTGKILQNRADASIEEIIDALKEDERIRAMRTQPATATDVYYSSSSNHGSGQCRGRGQGTSHGGAYNKENRWCNVCQTSTHNMEKCYFKAEPSNKRHCDTSETILIITVEGPDTNLQHAQSGKEVRLHMNRPNTPEQRLVARTSLPRMVRPATALGTDCPTQRGVR
jgi:hypothetical protein